VLPNDLQSQYLQYLSNANNQAAQPAQAQPASNQAQTQQDLLKLGIIADQLGLAKGGKVGSDLADLQLHRLVG
jgi:hypothetical protein